MYAYLYTYTMYISIYTKLASTDIYAYVWVCIYKYDTLCIYLYLYIKMYIDASYI